MDKAEKELRKILKRAWYESYWLQFTLYFPWGRKKRTRFFQNVSKIIKEAEEANNGKENNNESI
ncbi:unnamed protein product [marine sediment metagenome]|uniref:Uncharacterized protein n=1 Tax=marine sediment metagenome TaxID=412755 RepID=X1A9S2_9ZZZZ